MLGMPVNRGSFSSRMMICASSCWIVLATRSVLRDISTGQRDEGRGQKKMDSLLPSALCLLPSSQEFYLIINQAHLRHHPHEIDQLAQCPFDVAAVVADHRHADDAAAVLVERPHFRNGDV